MIPTADTTMLVYAHALAAQFGCQVQRTPTVRPGLMVIDAQLQTIAVHPDAARFRLRQNSGHFKRPLR